MQKKLIAAAVAALMSTGAMAQVTMYGIIDVSHRTLETDTTPNGGATATTKVTDSGHNQAGSLSTSRLGWRIGEDLGGGLSAMGVLELGINNAATSGGDHGGDAAAPFVTRLAYVGLKNDAMGAISLGRQTVLVDTIIGGVSGFNNTVGSMYSSVMKFNNSRSSNQIQYASPNFSGFSFAAAYANGETDTAGSANSWQETGVLLKYSAGPLNVAFAMSDEEGKVANVVTQEPSQMALSADYNFGVAKVYATYMDGDNKAAGISGRDGMEIGANFPLGKVDLFASYFTGEQDNTVAADIDLSGYQLGAKYNLSKRTTAYAIYGSDEQDVLNGTDTERTNLALGIRHIF